MTISEVSMESGLKSLMAELRIPSGFQEHWLTLVDDRNIHIYTDPPEGNNPPTRTLGLNIFHDEPAGIYLVSFTWGVGTDHKEECRDLEVYRGKDPVYSGDELKIPDSLLNEAVLAALLCYEERLKNTALVDTDAEEILELVKEKLPKIKKELDSMTLA